MAFSAANCGELGEVVMLGANGDGVTLSTSNVAFCSKIAESDVMLMEGVGVGYNDNAGA